MKLKSVFAASMIAACGIAVADSSVNVQYFNQEAKSNGASSHYVTTGFKTSVTNRLAVDVSATQSQADATNLVTNRWEAGLTANVAKVGPAALTVRGASGVKQKSGVESFSYYSIEPNIAVALPANFSASYGWRYRDSYEGANGDYSITDRYTVSYNLSKNDKISVRHDDQRGGSDSRSTGLIYTRSF
jgi:hypothetical protein